MSFLFLRVSLISWAKSSISASTNSRPSVARSTRFSSPACWSSPFSTRDRELTWTVFTAESPYRAHLAAGLQADHLDLDHLVIYIRIVEDAKPFDPYFPFSGSIRTQSLPIPCFRGGLVGQLLLNAIENDLSIVAAKPRDVLQRRLGEANVEHDSRLGSFRSSCPESSRQTGADATPQRMLLLHGVLVVAQDHGGQERRTGQHRFAPHHFAVSAGRQRDPAVERSHAGRRSHLIFSRGSDRPYWDVFRRRRPRCSGEARMPLADRCSLRV